MKKKLFISLFCAMALLAQSQNTEENSPSRADDPCSRPEIVTNPFAPQNTEWFSLRNRFNWMDYVTYHNGLKMGIPYFDVNNLYGSGNNSFRLFVNPFFDEDEIYLRHINLFDNPNLHNQLSIANDFTNLHLLADEMDITSVEQGWELLWKFDGFEADGNTPISNASAGDIKAANFILYNRYTGMLRWFMAPKVNGTTYTELEPSIEFKTSQLASLFRNYNGLDQALDKPTIVKRATSPAKTSFNLPYFSMADFNISYDPCVCYFDSKLNYQLNGITSANIDLFGRLEGTSQMLNASSTINTDRLLSLYKNNENGFREQVKNGLLEYKKYEELVKDFKKLDGKSNIFDDVYSASKVAADIAEFGFNFVLSTKSPEKAWKSLKTIAKFTGFASMPFKTDKTTKSPPMLIQAQMSLTGQLNSTTQLNGFSFDMFTPGSYRTSYDLNTLNAKNNPDRFEYPIYNEAMGLYAMLKTPTKEKATANGVEVVITAREYASPSEYNTRDTPEVVAQASSSIVVNPREVFKLNHDISYTFNPSAQINVDATKVEAAWMIEVENFDETNKLWSFTSPNMFKTYSYQNSNGKTITVFSSEFLPIECISQFIPTFNIDVAEEAKNIFYEDFVFTDPSLSNMLRQQLRKLSNTRPKILDTYLKMNITYRYNKPDKSGLNDIVNFETYKYLIEGNESNQNLLEYSNNDMLSAPSELVIGTRHFTAPETIFAWDKITINGKISSDPGVEVIIQSAGEIIVEPDAQIYSEVLLLIGRPTVCNQARIQPVSINEAFCKNKERYAANIMTKKGNEAPTPDPVNEINKSIIYPNPTTTGNFTVATKLEKDSYLQVAVFDLMGKLLHKKQSAGNLSKGVHQTEFNDLMLEQGMYLVEVETNEGKSIHRLMIK